MAEVGRRFEVLGRASLARRAELARYQAGELEELFSETLAHAEPPHEGHPEQLPALRRAFVEGPLRALTQELARPEQRELAQVFAQTAAACNGCHQASGHGFIEVSPALGAPVPRLDPLP